MSSNGPDEALALLRAGVDGLLAAGLDGLSGLEAARLIESLEVQRRRLDAVDARVLAEADRRGVAGEFGRTSTTDLLAVRVSGRRAGSQGSGVARCRARAADGRLG